jgi:hypothetical protein
MTITVDITPEVQAELARQAAAQGRALEAYVANLLKQAAQAEGSELANQTARLKRQRHPGRKSLAQLFAESPFRGLDLDFERDRDFGRDIEL